MRAGPRAAASPFQLVPRGVLHVLSGPQLIVRSEEPLPQRDGLVLGLLGGGLLLSALHLKLQPLQLAATPLGLLEELHLRGPSAEGRQNNIVLSNTVVPQMHEKYIQLIYF